VVKKRPETAEEWAALSDAEVVTIGQEYGAHSSVTAQTEMMRRLTVALEESKKASNKAAGRLLFATWVLVVLTAVLALDALARVF